MNSGDQHTGSLDVTVFGVDKWWEGTSIFSGILPDYSPSYSRFYKMRLIKFFEYDFFYRKKLYQTHWKAIFQVVNYLKTNCIYLLKNQVHK